MRLSGEIAEVLAQRQLRSRPELGRYRGCRSRTPLQARSSFRSEFAASSYRRPDADFSDRRLKGAGPQPPVHVTPFACGDPTDSLYSMSSFVRGIFAGALHDELLFPFPPPLDVRDPAEAATVRRLIGALRQMRNDGLIDSAAFDEAETVPEPTIRALAEHGLLGLTIPTEYGGAGLSAAGYARVFGEISRLDASLAVLIGVHCGLGSKAIVLFGTPSRRRATFRRSRAARCWPPTRSPSRTSAPTRRTSKPPRD